MNRAREPPGLFEVRRGRLAPYHVGVGGVGQPSLDCHFEPTIDHEEALLRPLVGEELSIPRVDVAGNQIRCAGVGPRQKNRGNTHQVCGEPCCNEGADELRGRHKDFASQVAALLLRGELVLVVNCSDSRLDHRLCQLDHVERTSKPRLPIRDYRREPVYFASPLGVLDLVGPLKRLVDSPGESRHTVGGIQALVRIGLACEVRVCGDLPAAEVNRLEARLDHLDRLTAS